MKRRAENIYRVIQSRLINDEQGQDLVEYGMLAALIAVVAILAVGTLGTKTTGIWTNIVNNV